MTPFIAALRLAQAFEAKELLAAVADTQDFPPVRLTVLSVPEA